LDYSRFNGFDRQDAEEATRKECANDEADAAGGLPEGMPDMRDMLRTMPPELQEAYHLMSISRQNGDVAAQQRANELALKAVEKGGPEVKEAFMKNVAEQMPEIAGKLNKDMDPKAMLDGFKGAALQQAVDRNKAAEEEDTTLRIDSLRTQMEEGQKATRAEMDKLQQKQEELERIKNPEDFFKFMTEEGMTQEDLQRIFSGDEQHMQDRFNDTIEEKTAEKDGAKESADALKKVNELHGALFGLEPEEPPAPRAVVAKPVRKAPAPPLEPEVMIPMYRLQYQKDEAGKYTVVELKCTLPGVADMSVINLDVSEKHLRLSTVSPAPRYAVNAGPFPVHIDPSGARAKYSKKREELSICVPAKLD